MPSTLARSSASALSVPPAKIASKSSSVTDLIASTSVGVTSATSPTVVMVASATVSKVTPSASSTVAVSIASRSNAATSSGVSVNASPRWNFTRAFSYISRKVASDKFAGIAAPTDAANSSYVAFSSISAPEK